MLMDEEKHDRYFKWALLERDRRPAWLHNGFFSVPSVWLIRKAARPAIPELQYAGYSKDCARSRAASRLSNARPSSRSDPSPWFNHLEGRNTKFLRLKAGEPIRLTLLTRQPHTSFQESTTTPLLFGSVARKRAPRFVFATAALRRLQAVDRIPGTPDPTQAMQACSRSFRAALWSLQESVRDTPKLSV